MRVEKTCPSPFYFAADQENEEGPRPGQPLSLHDEHGMRGQDQASAARSILRGLSWRLRR